MIVPGRSVARAMLTTCVLVSLASADDRVPLRVLVRSTDVAPGVTPARTYGSIGGSSIAENGRITFSSSPGRFSGFAGGFVRVVRSSVPAPDMPPGVSLANVAEPWLNVRDEVGFLASLRGSGYDNAWAVFAGPLDAPRLLVRSGAPAPDVGGAILGDISDRWFVTPPMNERGEMVFVGTLGDSSFDSATWSGSPGDVRLVARRGALLPGRDDGARFGALHRSLPAINDAGTVAFGGEIACGTNCFRAGVWIGRPGEILPVAQPDDPAPGLPDGARIGSFSADSIPALNERGDVAVLGSFVETPGSFRTYGAIWVGSPGTLELLARTGVEPPGVPVGVTLRSLYSDWSQPSLTHDGEVVFVGILEGPGVDPDLSWGLWKGRPGALRLLARAGDQAPGLSEGVRFGNHFLDAGFVRPIVNGLGRAAFLTSLSGPGVDDSNRYGVWAVDADERVRLVVRYGEAIEVAPGDARIVRSVERPASLGGQMTSPPNLNDRGELVLAVAFTDGTSALLLATLPEPSTTSIAPSADTYVHQAHAHSNEGASTFLRVGSRPRSRALLAFESAALRAALGEGDVRSARLELEVAANEGAWRDASATLALHRMPVAWAEGNGATRDVAVPHRGDGSGATWACAIDADVSDRARDCTAAAWRMNPDPRRNDAPWITDPSALVPVADSTLGTLSFDVTSDVRTALVSDDALSWILVSRDRPARGAVRLAAREAGAVGPRLVVTFMPAGESR